MDTLLILLGILCLLAGLAGCVVPMLPGPPIAYVALLLVHFTERAQFTYTQLIIWLAVVIGVQILDYFIPMMGTRKFGGTRWGTWGCLIGTFAGLFFFPPWGIIIGPFAGAVIGELLGGKETNHAIKAGIGAVIGFLLGTILKFTVCGWFIYEFVGALV